MLHDDVTVTVGLAMPVSAIADEWADSGVGALAFTLFAAIDPQSDAAADSGLAAWRDRMRRACDAAGAPGIEAFVLPRVARGALDLEAADTFEALAPLVSGRAPATRFARSSFRWNAARVTLDPAAAGVPGGLSAVDLLDVARFALAPAVREAAQLELARRARNGVMSSGVAAVLRGTDLPSGNATLRGALKGVASERVAGEAWLIPVLVNGGLLFLILGTILFLRVRQLRRRLGTGRGRAPRAIVGLGLVEIGAVLSILTIEVDGVRYPDWAPYAMLVVGALLWRSSTGGAGSRSERSSYWLPAIAMATVLGIEVLAPAFRGWAGAFFFTGLVALVAFDGRYRDAVWRKERGKRRRKALERAVQQA